MENVKRWFYNHYEGYDLEEYDGNLEIKTSTALFLVVEPHDGNGNRWMLRATTISAFDRWANSTPIEEFFRTDIELCNYLHEHRLDIYKKLLEYLSEEYDDLQEAYYDRV